MTLFAICIAVMCLLIQGIFCLPKLPTDNLKMLHVATIAGIIMFLFAGYGRLIMDTRASVYGDDFMRQSDEVQEQLNRDWKEYVKDRTKEK